MTNWGCGVPRREFPPLANMAAACLHLLEHYVSAEYVNVGSRRDQSITEIAAMVAAGCLQADERCVDCSNRTAGRARVDGGVVLRARSRRRSVTVGSVSMAGLETLSARGRP
jgi:hypothetical protein